MKETKKQLVEMQQTKQWTRSCTTGWKVKLMIENLNELVNCFTQIEMLICQCFIIIFIKNNIFYRLGLKKSIPNS